MSDKPLAPSNQDSLPPDYLDTLSERMNKELQEIGLKGKLVALTLKEEALMVEGYGSPIVLIPVDILLKSAKQSGSLDEESFTLGLRYTIEQLRPHGPTLLLAESLLSLARASRRYIGQEDRLELALEAIDVLKRCDGKFELGRAYLDLGVILKDGNLLYDALYVFNTAIRLCSEQQDSGGVSAGYYQRANISRMLEQHFEALQILDQADQFLPALDSARNWKKQILSERIFNLMALDRLKEALPHVNNWIALKDGINTPYFIRGQINLRSGNHHQAMEDFCEASLLLSREILRRRTGRFQRVDRALNRSIFERSFLAAVHEDEPLIALALLELANTGGIGLPVEQASEEKSFEAEAVQDLAIQAKQLSQQANQALLSQDITSLAEFQDRADWLVSQWEYLFSQDTSIPSGIEDVRQAGSRLISSLPPDAALIEIAETANTTWVIACSREGITIRDTGLNAFDSAMVARSFRFECDGGFYNDSLEFLANHLLGPVTEPIQGKEKLYILPSPMLQSVPFHAMPWEGQPLIENHEVSYISSGIAQFTAAAQPGAPISLLSRCSFFGVPHVAYKTIDQLPGVLNEAEAVRGSFSKPQIYIDSQAVSDVFLAPQEAVDVLHVACHGVYQENAPLLSHLLLADRVIFAFEIILARLNCQLAVLSACQTGEGLSQPGGYIQSLASSFVKSGTGTVVASFWPVDDRAGSVFIQKFYKELLENRRPPVNALNEAQRFLIRQPDFAHPYFWSPFAIFSSHHQKE